MDEATELASAVDSKDPRVGLRAVAALRRLLEQLETLQVANARANGWSWQEIAAELDRFLSQQPPDEGESRSR